jgi:UPF0716 protein FxsA
MFGYLLLLFVGLPLIELALLIKVGQWLGLVPTLAIVILTGIIGATLARWQGFVVYLKIQQDLAVGQMPADKMVDGLMILIGGVVLLTPGILTDLFGFCLLIPGIRQLIKKMFQRRFSRMVDRGETRIFIQF